MTANGRYDEAAPALGRYWDDVVQGRLADSGELDPALVATVQALHARDNAPDAHRAFAARLWADLEDHIASAPAAPRPSASLMQDDVRAGVQPKDLAMLPSLAPADASKPSSLRWVSTQLATAAIVVLTLVAGYVALSVTRPGKSSDAQQSLQAPAPELPALAPADPATQQGLLAQMTATGLPPDADYVAVERWTYPPHSDPVTTSPLTGPMLIFVITGELTATVDGGGAMLSGNGQIQLEATLNTSTGGVAAGEALLIPAEARLTTRNDAATETVALAIPIISNDMDDWTLPYDQTTIRQELLASTRSAFSAAPASVALRRAVLEPGAQVPAPPAGTLQLVASETKYLGYLGRAPDGTVTNLEKEPLGVLIVTVSQA